MDLPESLDETYERILNEIKKPNRSHARRVLQCLVVAIRPLHVAELAEVLAVDFDDAEGIPRSKRIGSGRNKNYLFCRRAQV
jgi:hypothetical protein